MPRTADSPDAAQLLDPAVVAARNHSRLPVVFAGRVVAGDLRISCLRGNRSEALLGLHLPPDVGLGGRALALGRPVSVRDYACARAITHEHDIAVAREGLRALVAVPVSVRGRVTAVLYGGARAAVRFGDQVITDLVAAGRDLGKDLDSVAGRGRAELRAAVTQLAVDLADTADQRLRAEALRTTGDLLAALNGQPPVHTPPALSPRELAVLQLAALGDSDAEIADQLGVAVGSVRGAMRSLRRAFRVHTRQAAVSAARAAGLLP